MRLIHLPMDCRSVIMLGNEIYMPNMGIKGSVYLKGFVLFVKDDDNIKGKILCGHVRFKGTGMPTAFKLLNEVKKHAIKNDIFSWEISFLNEKNLLDFYMKFGFIRYKNQSDNAPTIKLCYNFNHDINNYMEELRQKICLMSIVNL